MAEAKHSYSKERMCMACGGMACMKSYADLRRETENKMAGGGEVESHEKGVHQPTYTGGSFAGNVTKDAHKGNTSLKKEDLHSAAKGEHKAKLSELRSMKKPHLYAEGGAVDPNDGSPVDRDKFKSFQDSLNSALGGKEAKADEPPVKKAEGGEVDGPADGDDEMIMDHCAQECMDAIEKKDKGAFKDALHVLVADLLKKLG